MIIIVAEANLTNTELEFVIIEQFKEIRNSRFRFLKRGTIPEEYYAPLRNLVNDRSPRHIALMKDMIDIGLHRKDSLKEIDEFISRRMYKHKISKKDFDASLELFRKYINLDAGACERYITIELRKGLIYEL